MIDGHTQLPRNLQLVWGFYILVSSEGPTVLMIDTLGGRLQNLMNLL
jgi:hypothetical protein